MFSQPLPSSHRLYPFSHRTLPPSRKSTYRKNRKSSVPNTIGPVLANESLLQSLTFPEDKAYLNEKDGAGARVLSKKEAGYRAYELSRLRDLEVGDLVTARMQSRDMLILGKVVNRWQTPKDQALTSIISMPEVSSGAIDH